MASCVGPLSYLLFFLDSATAATTAINRKVAEEAAEAAASGGEGGAAEKSEMEAFMDMSKLNTARVRKATDPKILDVKRRVREMRRKLKRDSKVALTDEIIFFDDVAGNDRAKV